MSAMRVMQQIIRQIFNLSCLCIVIFVSILHVSNTETNKIDDENDDKLAKKKNKKFIIFIILFGSLTIGVGIGICVYRLIKFICDRQSRRIAPVRDNESIFVVYQDMIIEELANNAPVRDNEPAILDQDERIHVRANNAPVRDNEPAILDQDERIHVRANNAPVKDNEPAVLDQDERIHERADNAPDRDNEAAVLDQGKEIYFDLSDIKFIDDNEEADEDEPSINNGAHGKDCKN